MRVLVQHKSRYDYPSPAALGPHRMRLRPAAHARATIESYALKLNPEPMVRWQQDPAGNHVAYVVFPDGTRIEKLEVGVEMALDLRPVNPFDFFVDPLAERVPFELGGQLRAELAPYLTLDHPWLGVGGRFRDLLASLPANGATVGFLVEVNRRVNAAVRYVIREEAGIWTPEETLREGRGSCRDSAVLLLALLRARGLAARFVSGYLVQLRDEGMLPDEPKGVDRDVVDLHAWAEAYVPGAGWIGLDATSGLFCGEGHIPLACTATPALASPIEGTSDVVASQVGFEMRVGRLGHEPRPSTPYEEWLWEAMVAAGDDVDRRLDALGLRLTVGGEPTFNSREHPDAPEWNGAALGATKTEQGWRLARELRRRLAPGGALLHRQGKHYPGESLPRWAIELLGRTDRRPIWTEPLDAPAGFAGLSEAREVATRLARRLGLEAGLEAAFEDPWRFLQDEAALPTDVDPHTAALDDPEDRRRLARVLDRGLAREVGFALPLARDGGEWKTERWLFRRGRLYLLPGDSPIGLRLPLHSLPPAPAIVPHEEAAEPPDPRTVADEEQERVDVSASVSASAVRTALCVETRDGAVHVFLPPLASAEDFFALLAEVDAVRRETGFPIRLEGYPPPPHPALFRMSVAPDPGVLEVNLAPTRTTREHADLSEQVFEAALHAGLHAEKYLLDGRVAGSGGGNHVTVGGPTPLASPFVVHPDLLASWITFTQHHPSLSFLFSGLFVGPTSQAPRVDEARHDSLYELEIALEHAFDKRLKAPPWLGDILFRHLLVDVAGNTHRAEICIDKLFGPEGTHARQGLVELRAFEMPPHPRMMNAQALLVRALTAALGDEPYLGPLVRWGQVLHDRFLLPYWLWRDFEDVLAFLEERGMSLPAGAFRPFLELRCPLVGTLTAGDVRLEVRNALEPWPVLGEELVASGTSRFVDSSMERVEVRVDGWIPERYQVLVNGCELPIRATDRAGEGVAGVRFRAWCPPHGLHAHLGIHHPLRFDVVDTWARRSIGGCAYHVWHPEGRAFDTPPLTRAEASARRSQRFTIEGPLSWPVEPMTARPHADAPYTLDLRRLPVDHPPPRPPKKPDEGA